MPGLRELAGPRRLPIRAGLTFRKHPRSQAADQQPPRTRRQAQSLCPVSSRSYLIYAPVTPAAIPAHQKVATDANGRSAFSADPPRARAVDRHQREQPRGLGLDVEPGDATPSTAASWALHMLSGGPHLHDGFGVAERAGRRGKLPSPIHSHVRRRIADPAGGPHIVPGSSATQWYWGSKYHVSTVPSDF